MWPNPSSRKSYFPSYNFRIERGEIKIERSKSILFEHWKRNANMITNIDSEWCYCIKTKSNQFDDLISIYTCLDRNGIVWREREKTEATMLYTERKRVCQRKDRSEAVHLRFAIRFVRCLWVYFSQCVFFLFPRKRNQANLCEICTDLS